MEPALELNLEGFMLTLEGKVDAYMYSPNQFLSGSTKPFLAYGKETLHLYVLKHNLCWEQGFEKEKQAYRRIMDRGGHPAILSVVEIIEKDGASYLVLPYICGENLDEVFEHHPSLSPLELYSVINPLCSALDFAYQQGILHRDIKPENIRLSRSDEQDHCILRSGLSGSSTYLFDFNTSVVADAFPIFTEDEPCMGTPLYISPESWRGEPVDLRHDLYALGVLAFKGLTGAYPFSDSGVENEITKIIILKEKHLGEGIPSATRLSHSLPASADGFFAQALAKDPLHRFQTAGEFCAEFKKLL